ncbi:DUF1194 domain-containing protein [Pararhodobacter aggregans]
MKGRARGLGPGARFLLAGVLAAGPAAAQECRLALVLAFDVSASVDQREYRLMMEGTAAALRAPEVQAAALSGAPVAVAAYVWAGRREQAIAADWRVIQSATDLAELADRLAGFPRPSGDPLGIWSGRTGVGAALAAGGRLLERAPDCEAQVIDLAGDGQNNDGPETVRFEAVTVNALAVAGNMPLDYDGAVDGLGRWYAANVLQGPGAFVLEAQGYEDFSRAMRIKLEREFRPLLLGAL